jgi:hypothetical protein
MLITGTGSEFTQWQRREKFDGHSNYPFPAAVAGDFNNDGIAELEYSFGGTLSVMDTDGDGVDELMSFPYDSSSCVLDVSGADFKAVYDEHRVQFTNPHVLAVVASPPHWDNVNYTAEGETSYGQTTSGASSLETSAGLSVGMSLGFEVEDIFGLFGLEFEASIKESVSTTFSQTSSWEESISYTTPQGEDMVVFTAIPYDLYYYKVVEVPTGSTYKVGDYYTVNLPRRPVKSQAELGYYNNIMENQYRIAVKHTVGDPKSYYTESEKNAFRTQFPAGIFSSGSRTVGQGSSTTTISRSQMTETEKGKGIETEVSLKVEVEAFNVKVGLETALTAGISYSNSVGQGTDIEGCVASMPADAYGDANKRFDWGLMAFPQYVTGSTYFLVTYWTR